MAEHAQGDQNITTLSPRVCVPVPVSTASLLRGFSSIVFVIDASKTPRSRQAADWLALEPQDLLSPMWPRKTRVRQVSAAKLPPVSKL